MLTSIVELAELLARQSETQSGVLVPAFRRAARNALFWPESAATLVAQNRSLVELSAIGPFIEKRLRHWIENPQPALGRIPPIRRDFLTLADAKSFFKKNPEWAKSLRGDLQIHTCWSDGSGTIAAMAVAARERGYEYIAITDHSKGLKIAGGIDERAELAAVRDGVPIQVARSRHGDAGPLRRRLGASLIRRSGRGIGAPVHWEDREFFLIRKPQEEAVERIKQFLQGYRRE